MIHLYHGSTVDIKQIDLEKSVAGFFMPKYEIMTERFG